MARRRGDSIGISWYPKGYKSDLDYSAGDKYDVILQDSKYHVPKKIDPQKELIARQNEIDNEILKGIVKLNFMVLQREKGQIKTCICGGNKIDYSERIPIKYRKDGKLKELTMKGKICKDCGRKYIIRKMLLEKYHEKEG